MLRCGRGAVCRKPRRYFAVSVYAEIFNVNIVIRQVKIRVILTVYFCACVDFVRLFIDILYSVLSEKICNIHFAVAFDLVSAESYRRIEL